MFDNNSLHHSNEGLSVSAKFYDKKVMIYVEGPDDVPFWDSLFNSVVSTDFYEIEYVGGKANLALYILGIEQGNINNAFAAADLDYLIFSEVNRSKSPYIIYTYGHSIENTMFCPKNISHYLRIASRSTEDYQTNVNRWYETFCYQARGLLPYDILNSIDIECKSHISNGENRFFSRSFMCYLHRDSDDINIDPNKIKDEISKHSDFNKKALKNIECQINSQENRDIRHIIQGHFIAEAAMNYIRKELEHSGHKQSISNDSFYTTFANCFAKCSPLCHDKLHVISRIKIAIDNYLHENG